METSKQPEALQVAEWLEEVPHGGGEITPMEAAAAAELRRQHAEINRLQAERDALLSALAPIVDFWDGCVPTDYQCSMHTNARAAISTATGAAA